MRQRTKMRLRFYMSGLFLFFFTVIIGVFFQYLVWLNWQMKSGLLPARYELFWGYSIVLFILSVTDILLFFRLMIQKKYW